jgi:hypothetical protein
VQFSKNLFPVAASIVIDFQDQLVIIVPGEDVMDSSGECDADRAGYEKKLLCIIHLFKPHLNTHSGGRLSYRSFLLGGRTPINSPYPVALPLDDDALVTSLKQVPYAAMAAVEGLRVDPIQPAHAADKVGFGGLDQEVIMIAHQAVGVAAPALLMNFLCQSLEEGVAIGVILIDGLTGVAPGRQVIHCPRELRP